MSRLMNRKQRIETALQKNLALAHLEVDDESSGHQVPQGSESHFKVVAVSNDFENKTKVARHRLINDFLKDEFKMGLHALSLHLYTNEEWQMQKAKGAPKTPDCQRMKK
ncbi:putative regulator of murein genes BolA (plasmid) [Legionella adelaidensis]|uniref:Protein BolA n=1 Tax=Legionella adelaidensis TaxID=45056 RepID=A0A0W0R322_9GAMM|nr:BolA family protein [Legionella adelaidensis]KTC65473.1 Protein BolA [Legionella adelaidensis]VEH84706.1 putative regulator of murein genes BolA [Legionella adelaidensis]